MAEEGGRDVAGTLCATLVGKKVRVTGWLYWEPDEEQGDPRGTRWEIHPVTCDRFGKWPEPYDETGPRSKRARPRRFRTGIFGAPSLEAR